MKSEKELYRIWKKYVDVPLYRVVSGNYIDSILKVGINPRINPYEKLKPKIFSLFNIIFRLNKEGRDIIIKWAKSDVTADYAAKTTIDDLKKPVVDFSPNKTSIKYYLAARGGALVSNIKKITDKILEEKIDLTNKELELVRGLNKWAISKTCNNKSIYVMGSCKCFEDSLFQLTIINKQKIRRKRRKRRYLPNPFGSFEHFKRIINKYRYKKYKQYIELKRFYLRVKGKIKNKDIVLMK